MALLSGCGADRTSDNPFVQKGQSQTSPSGKYVAKLVVTNDKGFTEFRPAITDTSGTTVWRNGTAFVERYLPGVTWEKDRDTLSVLSGDVGHSSVKLVDGQWVQTFGKDGMPEFIAKWANS